MSAPGKAFSRDDLLSHVYERGETVIDRVVDVHIGHLRQKLADDPAEPRYIETVRGFGYRFAERQELMRLRLHWKLMLVTTIPVIAVITGIIWLAFDQLAADYFMVLMDKYMVSPTDTHRAFLTAVHRYLLWASLVALLLAFALSYLLTKRVLRPLVQMSEASHQIAAGNFTARVDASQADEIGELGTAFNLMGDSLEKLERLRKTMVADVAHELRTPLTNLRGYLEGLSDGVIPADKQTLEMLQQENLRLVTLVEGPWPAGPGRRSPRLPRTSAGGSDRTASGKY